jgi:hypothetical protein
MTRNKIELGKIFEDVIKFKMLKQQQQNLNQGSPAFPIFKIALVGSTILTREVEISPR